MKVLILLPLLLYMMSCTWLTLAKTAVQVIDEIPPDSFLEELIEEELEEHFNAPPGSIDLSIFTPED